MHVAETLRPAGPGNGKSLICVVTTDRKNCQIIQLRNTDSDYIKIDQRLFLSSKVFKSEKENNKQKQIF